MLRILLFYLLLSPLARGQHSALSSTLSGSTRSLAGAGICRWEGEGEMDHPAHLALAGSYSIQMTGLNYYLIPGINSLALTACKRLDDRHVIGWSGLIEGSEDLQEGVFSLAFARKLHAHTQAGIGLLYMRTMTPTTEDIQRVSFELGLQSRLCNGLLAGFVLRNPIPTGSAERIAFPPVFKTGVNYKVQANLEALLEIHKYGKQNLAVTGGIRYRAVPGMVISCGVNTNGPKFALGFQYRHGDAMRWQIFAEHHLSLGFSPGIGWIYQN
ncbi:MAG TPA: hypothetical protein VFX48_06540 [Saprospiraceae bacterium]|nr:hypothetical protein [Saprospiraceae bacterium]